MHNYCVNLVIRKKVICFNTLSIHDAQRTNVSELKAEREMRFLCADIGKKVCGICVAELYGDYD